MGLEKLRVRLAAKDIDTIWQVLDGQKRGFANFNDFCVLQETRAFQADPYAMKSLEVKVQDNLAAERKAERDRIALEIIEKMSQAGSDRVKAKTQQPFGIVSLPTDNMHSIMQNEFNKEYIRMKISYDDTLEQQKMNKITKSKIRRDTNSNRLKTERQVALAQSLKDENLISKNKKGADARTIVEEQNVSQTGDGKKEDSVLPPLVAHRGKTTSANPLVKPSKFLRKNFPVDIAATQPRGNFTESGPKKTEPVSLNSAFASLQISTTKPLAASNKTLGGIDIGQLRAQKNEMMRNYLSTKQALDAVKI